MLRERAMKFKTIVYSLAGLFCLTVPIVIGLVPVERPDSQSSTRTLSFIMLGVYSIQLVSYCVTIAFLNSTLKKMNKFGDFREP